MALTAMWVHGNAFVPERPMNGLINVGGAPWTEMMGLRQGWGVTFQGRAGQSCIFHAPIPTPVIVNNTRARLKKVFVTFNARDANDVDGAAERGANVIRFDVWDGSAKIGTAGEFRDFGNHLNRLDTSSDAVNFPQPPEIRWGLGVSVWVTFFTDNSLITFGSAGADFEV